MQGVREREPGCGSMGKVICSPLSWHGAGGGSVRECSTKCRCNTSVLWPHYGHHGKDNGLETAKEAQGSLAAASPIALQQLWSCLAAASAAAGTRPQCCIHCRHQCLHAALSVAKYGWVRCPGTMAGPQAKLVTPMCSARGFAAAGAAQLGPGRMLRVSHWHRAGA